MKTLAVILGLIPSLLLGSCSSSSFASLDNLKINSGNRSFPTQRAYPHDDAVVLKEVHDVKVFADDFGYLDTDWMDTTIVKLFKNVADYSSVEFTIHRGETLESVSAWTIEPNGSVIALKSDDFKTIPSHDEGDCFSSDKEIVKFTFKGVERNCIVGYDYRIRSMYVVTQGLWAIQREIPILENTYRLTAPIMLVIPARNGGYGINWKYQGFNCTLGEPQFESEVREDMLAIHTKVIRGTATMQWERKNIPAFGAEPMMPPHSDYIKYARFTLRDWTTWGSIARWYYGNYFKPQRVITVAVRRKARAITKSCRTEIDSLQAVYSFVQSLRYVAAERGRREFRPVKPQKVLERGYGDCKDKAMLLVSMLKCLKIDAKPALVRTRDKGGLALFFPCWEFNRMVVRVKCRNGSDYWLDPTVKYCPVGEVPYEDQGAYALVLNGKGPSLLEPIRNDGYTTNLEEQDIRVSIGGGNAVDYDVTLRFMGQQALSLRPRLSGMTYDDQVAFCKSLLAPNYRNDEVTFLSSSNLDSIAVPLVLKFKLKVPHTIETSGDSISIDPDPMKPVLGWGWLSASKRRYPVEFNYHLAVQKTIEVDFPYHEYSVETAPVDTTLLMNGLYYSESCLENGSGPLTLSRSFSIVHKVIAAKYFGQMKGFVKSMRRLSAEGIFLTKERSMQVRIVHRSGP